MTREQRWAVNNLSGIFKTYLEECPEESTKIFTRWKRGLITSDEAVKEAMKIALPER